jgi:hypothetical protein
MRRVWEGALMRSVWEGAADAPRLRTTDDTITREKKTAKGVSAPNPAPRRKP